MRPLDGRIALVTGASRGLGRGIAIGLGEAGATVYLTGRTEEPSPDGLSGSLQTTAREVREAGGEGVAVVCDHRDDAQVAAVFERISAERGRLDVLVNNVLGSPDQRVLWDGRPFWEVPFELWDQLIDVGLRSHFVASALAVPLLSLSEAGVIVNVSSRAAARGRMESGSKSLLPYSVGKAGLRRLTGDMAHDLASRGVAVIEIWPPGTLTEGVVAQLGPDNDLTGWRDPVFTGRVLAALLSRGGLQTRSGDAIAVAELADELGVSDPA